MSWVDKPRETWEEAGYRIADHTTSRPVDWSRVENIVIHYSGAKTINPDTAQKLRGSQRDYVNNRGYSLGYSVAVDQQGVSWEIRGTDFIPAANKNYNGVTWVIQVLVNWQDGCNPAMVDTVRNLVKFARSQIQRDVPVIGHRDIGSTRCPGDGVYTQIQNKVFEPRAPQPQPGKDFEMKLINPPTRVYDSRKDSGGMFDSGETRRIQTGYRDAVFVNVTVVAAEADGFLTLWGDGARPDVSNVNYRGDDTIANSAWVPVDPTGAIQVYCYGKCHVLIDVQACSK